MSTRLDLAGASVLPFQFPPLKDRDAENRDIAVQADIGVPPAVPVETSGTAHEAPEQAAELEAELARARDEGLRRGLEEGRLEGYAAGFAEGRSDGEAKLAEEVHRLLAIAGGLGGPLAAMEQSVEEAIVALALEAARCVIGDEVKRSHEFLARLVREAIAQVPLQMGAPRVLLNPADLELIRTSVPEVETGGIVLVGDDTIEPGGCRVIADGEERPTKDRRWNPRPTEGVSQIDLTLSSRWRAVMLALFDGEDG